MDFLEKYSIMNKNNKFKKNMFKKIGFITLGTFLFVNSVFTGDAFAGTTTQIEVNGLVIDITRNIGEEREIYNVTANDSLTSLEFDFTGTDNHLNLQKEGAGWNIDFKYGTTYNFNGSYSTALVLDFIGDEIPEVELTINDDRGITTATFAISKELSDAYFNKILASDAPFQLNASNGEQTITVTRNEGEYIFSSSETLGSELASIVDGSNRFSILRVGDDKFKVEGSYNGKIITVDNLDLASIPEIIPYGDMHLAVVLDTVNQKWIKLTPNASLIEEIKNRLLKERVTEVSVPASGELDISLYPNATNITVGEDAKIKFSEEGGSIKINNTLTVNSSVANGMKIIFDPDTIITGLGDDRKMDLPKILTNASASPDSQEGYTTTIETVIKVGLSEQTVEFTKPVRLVFPGKAGKEVGFVKNGFHSIQDCDLNDGSFIADECKKDSGNDLVILTNHFTEFVVYRQTATNTGTGGGPIQNYLTISNVNVSTQSNAATITFNISSSASATLKYGTIQGSYPQQVNATGTATSHSFTLPSLSNGTYYYKIEVDDNSGSTAVKEGSFTIGTQQEGVIPGSVIPQNDLETSTKIKEQKTYNYNGIITTKPITEMNKSELYRLFLLLLLKSLLLQRGITL